MPLFPVALIVGVVTEPVSSLARDVAIQFQVAVSSPHKTYAEAVSFLAARTLTGATEQAWTHDAYMEEVKSAYSPTAH